MSQAEPFDVNKDMEHHPEISRLIRAIVHGDPFVVGESGKIVIIGGGEHRFQFTKSAAGYTFEQVS
jgi:hypothetical protein